MKRIALMSMLLLPLLMLLVGAPTGTDIAYAQATSPATQNTCSLLPPYPPGYEPDDRVTQGTFGVSIVEQCSRALWKGPEGGLLYGTGWGVTIRLQQHKSAADAKTEADREATTDNFKPYQQPYAIGDTGWESFTDNMTGGKKYILTFVRGCFYAHTETGTRTDWPKDPPPEQRVDALRDLAKQLDQNLIQNEGRCQDVAETVPAAALTVGLACNTDQLDSSGAATCAASVTNQRENASISYEWRVDGNVQTGVNGEQLALDGLNPGTHSVSVQATDTTNNVSAGPQNLSFTRATARGGPDSTGIQVFGTGAGPSTETPPSPGTGEQSGSSTYTPPPITLGTHTPPPPEPTSPPHRSSGMSVSGPATAVALAIGILILIRLGLRGRKQQLAAPPNQPESKQPAPPPPPQPAGPSVGDISNLLPPGPLGGPVGRAPTGSLAGQGTEAESEQPAEQNQNKDEPQLIITPIVSLSRWTEVYHQNTKNQIWGDEVDLVFVGYHLKVIPDDWTIQPNTIQDNFTVDKGICKRINLFYFSEPIKLTANRKAVIQAPWCDQDDQMTVSIDVQASVSGPGRPRTLSASKTRALSIVGADPHLILKAEPNELTGQAGGNADGSDRVLVTPNLFLFGQPYAGGLQVSEVINKSGIPDNDFLDIYFKAKGEEYAKNVDYLVTQQKLELTCKFHLLDRDMKKLAGRAPKVSFRVEPTGSGPGMEAEPGPFAFMKRAHYESCKRNLKKDYPVTPAEVPLQPSVIDFDLPTPTKLPDPNAPLGKEFRTILRATVRSASGEAVPGSAMYWGGDYLNGKSRRDKWQFKFKYDRPDQDPLNSWDPYFREGQWQIDARDVDEKGRILFRKPGSDNDQGLVPECVYDHWEAFYDKDARYLGGQCCQVKAVLVADQEKFDVPQKIFIGPPTKIYVYVDEGDIKVKEFVGHVSVGLIDLKGQEVRVGFFPDKFFSFDRSTGQAVGTVGGFLAGGGATAALASFFGASMAVLTPPAALCIIAGAVAGGAVGSAEGNSGTGRLHDDGGASSKAEDEKPYSKLHEFHICRGWDISRDEYEHALQNMKEWKKNSDTLQLFWEMSGVVYKRYGKFAGNCTTFANDMLESVGLPALFNYALDFYRPGNMGAVLKKMPRLQVNSTPSEPKNFLHPWRYSLDGQPGTTLVSMHRVLGKTDPPPTPNFCPAIMPENEHIPRGGGRNF